MRTTATMMFGCGEEYSPSREPFQPAAAHAGRYSRIYRVHSLDFCAAKYAAWEKVPETTAFDYLKTLAISRLYLDNIDDIQSSWLMPGIKICQVGLQLDVRRPIQTRTPRVFVD